jgi:hypothetical protein
MTTATTRRGRQTALGQKLLALAGGLFCFALILVPLVWRPQQQREEAPQQRDEQAPPAPAASAHTKKVSTKSHRAWNVALGDVVMVAPDLGLSVAAPKDFKIDLSRLNTTIDRQLTSLREIYRAQSEKQKDLMGGLLLEFTIGHGGNVSQVREITSRINNAEFGRAVLTEVSKWNFNEVLPEGVIIRCPLLFVREGMEITTLTQWEKGLGLLSEKSTGHGAAGQKTSNPLSDDTALSKQDKAVETREHALNAPTLREGGRERKTAAKGAPVKSRRGESADGQQEPPAALQTERNPL